jgi:hypothetical protein
MKHLYCLHFPILVETDAYIPLASARENEVPTAVREFNPRVDIIAAMESSRAGEAARQHLQVVVTRHQSGTPGFCDYRLTTQKGIALLRMNTPR